MAFPTLLGHFSKEAQLANWKKPGVSGRQLVPSITTERQHWTSQTGSHYLPLNFTSAAAAGSNLCFSSVLLQRLSRVHYLHHRPLLLYTQPD